VNETLKQDRAIPDKHERATTPRRAASSARAARVASLLSALLLAIMCVNLLTAMAHKSITTDEIPLIPAAYFHLVTSDFRLVSEHPPLAKLLAGTPLLFLQLNRDARTPTPEEYWTFTVHFWEENRADFGRISFWSRVPLIALTVALGILVFVFARDLFGARAAVLAVALFSLEPTVLAHGRIVQTDIPATFGYLLFFYALYCYTRAPTWMRALALGLAAGVALIAKFSMLIAAPVLALAFALFLWRAPRVGRTRTRVFADACIVLLASLLVIHAAYAFDSRALSDADARWVAASFPAHAESVMRMMRALSHVLPTDFVLGVFWQIHHNAEGHPASLLGAYSRTGWWYYFPVAFALKTTLPFLLLSLASLAWGCREFYSTRERRFLWLLAPFAIYTALVMSSRIDIGVRYYLPAYPFLFILSGALLDRLMSGAIFARLTSAKLTSATRARRAGLVVTCVLLGWCVVEAARVYPDYIPYMNQLARGRPHWQMLSDSNVEWGDDIRGMAEYLRARGETRVRGALLGGHFTPQYYGIEFWNVLIFTDAQMPATRYVAVGASFLNGSPVPLTPPPTRALTEAEMYNFFDAYRRRTPEAVIGGSIYLYREADE
jgi:4-amino-4-deoxy-L-arabinose transferase-like glycosyltransferase